MDNDSKDNDTGLKQIKQLIEIEEYQRAFELLHAVLQLNPTDAARRLFIKCGRKLSGTDLHLVVQVAESIVSKTLGDLADLSCLRLDIEDYPGALATLDKCILVEDTGWAHYVRALALRQFKSVFACEEDLRLQVKEELQAAVRLPRCPEQAFLDLGTLVPLEEELSVLDKAVQIYPQYSEVRLRYSKILLGSGRSEDALSVLDPILESKTIPVLALATQASRDARQSREALQHLSSTSEEFQRLPGFGKIKGDLLLDLDRVPEAIDAYNQEVASDHLKSRIVGLFSRADANFRLKKHTDAVADAKLALSMAFDSGEFDFSGELFWLREFEGFDYLSAALSVCRALHINEVSVLNSCDEETRWQARFFDWVHQQSATAPATSQPWLDDLTCHLPQPSVSQFLSDYHLNQGNVLESVQHHIKWGKWRLSLADRPKFDVGSFYLDDDKYPKKTQSLKIHRLLKAELEACSDTLHITELFVPLYLSFWRTLLQKHDLYAEINVVAETLVKFGPENPDLLWDSALSLHRLGPSIEGARRAEIYYKAYLQIVPTGSAAAYNLSLLAEHIGKSSEAWEYIQLAHSLDPENEKYASRHRILKNKEDERRKDRELRDFAKQVADNERLRPVLFESLDLRCRVYLSALLRCSLTEDQRQILSIDESPGKLTPSRSASESVLMHLWRRSIIVVDHDSPAGSYSRSDRDALSIHVGKVRWLLNLESSRPMSRAAIISKLCDPPPVADDEIEAAIALWRELALEESLEYL